jgi:hypothetical protein
MLLYLYLSYANSPFGRYEDDSDDLDDGEPETHWQPEKPDTDDEETEETSTEVYTHIYISIYSCNIYTYMHTYIHTYIHAYTFYVMYTHTYGPSDIVYCCSSSIAQCNGIHCVVALVSCYTYAHVRNSLIKVCIKPTANNSNDCTAGTALTPQLQCCSRTLCCLCDYHRRARR